MKMNINLILCIINLLLCSITLADITTSEPEDPKTSEPEDKKIEKIIKELILKIDSNKDGLIGKDELRKYLEDTKKLPWYVPLDSAVDKICEKLDFNPKDRKISEKEMKERKQILEDNL